MGQFLQSISEEMQRSGYSLKAAKSASNWIGHYIKFINNRNPKSYGSPEVGAYLSLLADKHNVSIEAQEAALDALLFLYAKILESPLGELEYSLATKPKDLPDVLNIDEVNAILARLSEQHKLAVALMYGSGLRVFECLQLRVQDINLKLLTLTVHSGNGFQDRKTMLSPQLVKPLMLAIQRGIDVQNTDVKNSVETLLPSHIAKKFKHASRSPYWAFIFPSVNVCKHPDTGAVCRHHLHASVIQNSVKIAIKKSGLKNKSITCHSLRHSFASELMRSGLDTKKVQKLLGHKDIRTTQVYSHIVGKDCVGIKSPLDNLIL